MTDQPNAAWVEAAQKAAADVYDAFGDMVGIELNLPHVARDDAAATNSCDRSFLDMLKDRAHLDASFLRDAR